MPEQGSDYVQRQRSKVNNIARRLVADLCVFAVIIGGFVLAGAGTGWTL